MEVLGYLHSAVAFESPLEIQINHTPLNREGRSPLRPQASCQWLSKPSLYLSALICSLSIVVGTAPHASALMRYGNTGRDVTQLQQELAAIGFFNGPVTGYYGPMTQEAVIQFQRAKGLAVDGIAGPNTLAALQRTTPGYQVAATNQGAIAPALSTVPKTVPSTVGLAMGATGPDVIQLQTLLRRLGFFTEQVTGYYGVVTQAAVTQFQRAYGLPATGVANASTLATLNRVVVSFPTNAAVIVPTAQTVPPVTQSAPQNVSRPPATPPSPLPSTDQVFYRGDSGAEVLQLQQALTRAGIYQGPITGYYGALTEEAVFEFQRLNDITPNGVTGPVTWQALRDTVAVI